MSVKRFLPGLAGVFGFAVCAMGALYLSILSPALAFPGWLWPIMLLSALESAYYAAYFLGPRTPLTLRLMELAIFLVPVYFFSGRVLNEFIWPAFLTLTSWTLARGYGSHLVFMERVADHLGDQGASTVSWEYESLASRERAAPLQYFWRRFFGFALVIVTLAITAHHQNQAINAKTLAILHLLGSIGLMSGLTLQGGAYLFRLQVLWGYAKAKVHPHLGRTWFRNLAIFSLLMVLMVNLAPVDYSPVTAQRVASLLGGLFEHQITMPPMEPSVEHAPEFEVGSEEQFPPVEQDLGLAGYILALLLFLLLAGAGLTILLALGLILVTITKGEVDRLRGLPRLAVELYMAVRRALSRLKQQLVIERDSTTELRLAEGLQKGITFRRRVPRPRGVRAMLRRMAKSAGQRGLVFRSSQTAQEYSRVLQENLPAVEDEVEGFFAGYHEVRYGTKQLTVKEEKDLLGLGARILAEIEATKKGE